MSQENVELVRRLQPPEGVDLTAMFRDDDFRMVMDNLAPMFDPGLRVIFHGLSEDPYTGLDALRQTWLDWLEPWESYRVEIERVSDAGEKVLVFSRDFGRRPGVAEEVELKGSAVWKVQDGRVVQAEFFTDRSQALEAAGLSD